MLYTFRKIAYLLSRERRSRWVALICLAIVASVVEMFGAALIYLLLAVIADPEAGVVVPVVGDLRELFDVDDDRTFLVWFAITVGVFFIGRAAIQISVTYAKMRLAQTAGARLSSRLMQGYLELPYAFHLHRNSSELVRNAHTTIRQISGQGFLQAIYVVSETAMIVGLLSIMALVTPLATALAVLVVGSAALLLLLVVQPRLKRQGVIAQEMEKRTLGAIQQSLQGVRDIKVLGAQQYFAEHYRRSRLKQARALYLNAAIADMPRNIVELALFGFIIILFVVSLLAGATTDELFATLGLFAYAGLRLMPAIQKLVGGLNNLKFAAPAIDHVVADLQLIEQVEGASPPQDADLLFTDRLRLERVGFTYEGTEEPALRDVELELHRGEVLGICGPTGGGKTTLTDLITGLLDPTEGRITVDGEDLRGSTVSWFRRLGVVPQMVFLTDDTLRRNIALGIDDKLIDEKAVQEALDLAQLSEFVDRIPDGLETRVGERGMRVSGGQRQRVAIARALYRRPEVLIFDEATSALDNATESTLMAALDRLRGGHTIVLVAHRLSTVRNCDRIAYVEGGRVLAVGTYDDLQQGSAGFRALSQGV